jgi:hypothetical protein
MFPNDFSERLYVMTLKKCFLFCCAISVCAVLQIGVYWGTANAGVNPCPKTKPKATIPCPLPGTELVSSCENLDPCTGYVSWIAATLNTDYQPNTSETYTTDTTNHVPAIYCATYEFCAPSVLWHVCTKYSTSKRYFDEIFTINECN